jgi:putative protein kinase ArgK-like GTPase of G3E family
MKYLLEISDMNGSGIGQTEDECRIESDTPIPIPGVGDRIQLSKSGVVQVVGRLYYFHEESNTEAAEAHVQLFCKEYNPNT